MARNGHSLFIFLFWKQTKKKKKKTFLNTNYPFTFWAHRLVSFHVYPMANSLLIQIQKFSSPALIICPKWIEQNTKEKGGEGKKIKTLDKPIWLYFEVAVVDAVANVRMK